MPAPNRRTFACFVLLMAAFTIYGSLVPFTFHARPVEDAWASFVWAMSERAMFESRSDAAANVMLGVPLGFGLMGLMFVERPTNRAREIVLGALILPGCFGFASAVEFAQLYVPMRTCAGSDVYCQGVGAAIGMLLWIVWGRAFVREARGFWVGSGSAVRVLLMYALLLVAIQTLPWDLNPSPKDVYKKLRDHVRFIPFSEFWEEPSGHNWEHLAKLAKVFGLFAPVGLLAARVPGRFGAGLSFSRVIGLAFGLAVVIEGIQLLVNSRVPSATDALVGGYGIVSGFALARYRPHGFGPSDVLGFGAWWLWMVLLAWGPLPFIERVPHATFDWLPGMSLESSNPLALLEELLVKFVLFGLGGAMLGAGDFLNRRAIRLAAFVMGLLTAGVIEALQTVFGSHSPSVTDALVGGLGSLLGAWFAEHLRNAHA